MRVVVPYTRLRREVLAPLTRWDQELMDVSGSDRAYFDVLSEIWAAGETTCVVEHDVIVNPTTLDELAACPHDWCAFPYQYCGEPTYGLGCVKFSADLIARYPQAIIRVGVMSDERHPRRHWCRLDAWLTTVLESEGVVRHEHAGEVGHIDHGCSHGCV